MYNYVCMVYNHFNDKDVPCAIKIGLTENYSRRFPEICREAETKFSGISCASLIPLFIMEGKYDRYVAERIEDELRMHYLDKVGYDRGFRKDWINIEGLAYEYGTSKEVEDMERAMQRFCKVGTKIIYRNFSPEKTEKIYSSFYEKIKNL